MKKTLLLIVILLITLGSYAQQHRYIGEITNEYGEKMIGVNITIKGTTTGTISSVQGLYILEANLDQY